MFSPQKQDEMQEARALFWGGLWVALGSTGVLITSIFYAIAPAMAALPIPNVSMSDALPAAISGQPWMLAAGSVGIFADSALAAGAFVLMLRRSPEKSGLATAGWAWLAITNLVFIIVDALVSRVLGPLAALGGPVSAFAGFKHLFDTLFVLGTAGLGVGSISVLWSELQARPPVAYKIICYLGLAAGIVGLISVLAYFAGFNLALADGASIGIGSFVFILVGIRIAWTARDTGNSDMQDFPQEREQMVNHPG